MTAASGNDISVNANNISERPIGILCQRIKRLIKFSLRTYEGWLTLSVTIMAIVALTFTYHCLKSTFIPSDEGWYMYLQKNAIADQIWRGHLLFSHWSVFNNILINRYFQFAISALCWGVFAYGLTGWLKRHVMRGINFFLVFGLSCLLLVKMEGNMVCTYQKMVPAFGAAAIGLTLLGLTKGRSWLFCMSGLAMSLLLPQKITSLTIVPVILAAIWVAGNHKWKPLLWTVGGFISGIIGYIIIVESPAQIWEWINGCFTEVRTGDVSHGSSVLTAWLRDTLFQYMHWIILAIMILSMANAVKKSSWLNRHHLMRSLIFIAVTALILYFFRLNVGPQTPYGNYFFIFQNLVITLVFIVVISLWTRFDSQTKAITCLLLISPVCLCFGTDTPIIHFNDLLCLSTPLLSLTVKTPIIKRKWITGVITIMCAIAVILVVKPPKPLTNWFGDRLEDQTVSMRTLGIDQDILISPTYADFIEFCQREIPRGSDVLPRTQHWGIVYLLDLKPVCHTYRTHLPLQPSTVNNAMEVLNSGRTLYVLTLDPDPYKYRDDVNPIEKLVADMQSLGCEVQTSTHPGHRLYKIRKINTAAFFADSL